MGRVKRDFHEYWERGWAAPEKLVCPDCLEDGFLKQLIRSNATARRCDYCRKQTRRRSAAPVEVIMPAVASALGYFYAEPTEAGVPYDGGFVVEPTDTSDALMRIPLDCNADLFEDISKCFSNTAWISAASGHWASSHRNQEWSWAWQAFADKVKHQSRHFFMLSSSGDEEAYRSEPLNVLGLVGAMAIKLGLILTIPAGTRLYRVREKVGNADWTTSEEQLGAPPNILASAGRMNPAGISYLYTSTTQSGALAEVLRGPPSRAVVATFEVIASTTVLDLTRLPTLPSVFDEAKRSVREAILFLEDFVEDICQPVQKDGREHISYVPSQVVSEYFAQVFKTSDGLPLGGIVYPSAIRPGGVNVAMFPRGNHEPFAHAVRFVDGSDILLNTWADFSKEIA